MQKMQAKSASKKAGVIVPATINFIICKFATFFLIKYCKKRLQVTKSHNLRHPKQIGNILQI